MDYPQDESVYRWEDSFKDWNVRSLTDAQAEKLCAAACRKYKVSPPWFDVGGGKGWSTYDPHEHAIRMMPSQTNRATVLHEAAHAICDTIFGDIEEHHGRHWLGIYMVLLEQARIAPRAALHASAKTHGLEWCSFNRIKPSAIRTTYRGMIRRKKEIE